MTSTALDHRQLVASLPDGIRRDLTTLSDFRGARAVAAYFAVLAATGGLIVANVPGWWALLLPHGILLIFLFTLLHEVSHRTVFATVWPNRLVGAVCGFLVLVPPLWFRYFHLAHHRHTHDPERDPELETPKPGTTAQYVVHVSGLPVWRGLLATLVSLAAGRAEHAYLPAGARPRAVAEARVMLAAYALLAAGSAALGSAVLLWVWVIPALLGQPFLRLYLLAEHGRCPHVADMLVNSRTTFTNRVVRWLAWNMPYHAEHHTYPTVPFHKLPALHRLAQAHLKQTERGYVRFNRRYVAAVAGRTQTSTRHRVP